MADITLEGGQEITFDLSRLTLREFRSLFDTRQKPEDEDVILSKVCGLTLEEYQALDYLSWRRLCAAFFERARNPDLKNSGGESTST